MLKEKKYLVWHSHNFLLPYITVEEYFIISIIFMFNLQFLCIVVDELFTFIFIVSLSLYMYININFNILTECGSIHQIFTIK